MNTMNMIYALRDQLRQELAEMRLLAAAHLPTGHPRMWNSLSCALAMTMFPNIAKTVQFLEKKSKTTTSLRKRLVRACSVRHVLRA